MANEKPFLDSIDTGPDQVSVIMEWAAYLGNTFGTSGALNALHYYERIGWISGTVREQVMSYLRGLSLGEIHSKKYNEPATLSGTLDSLSGTPFGAHARSLRYVAAIADHDLQERVMVARLARRRVDNRFDGIDESAISAVEGTDG